jgi:hypothetical protein
MDRGAAARTGAGAFAALSLLLLGGCSGTASPDSSSSPAANSGPATSSGSATSLPTDSSAPSVSAEGTTAAVIGPIVVEPTQTDVVATVGRFLDFNVGPNPGEWKISSANEAVVGELMQGGERDGATYNPAAKALSVGSATVTLENSAGLEALVFKVQVTE